MTAKTEFHLHPFAPCWCSSTNSPCGSAVCLVPKHKPNCPKRVLCYASSSAILGHILKQRSAAVLLAYKGEVRIFFTCVFRGSSTQITYIRCLLHSKFSGGNHTFKFALFFFKLLLHIQKFIFLTWWYESFDVTMYLQQLPYQQSSLCWWLVDYKPIDKNKKDKNIDKTKYCN